MEPWYKVAKPRREVRGGRSFNPDEFAIALEQVVAGTVPEFTRLKPKGSSPWLSDGSRSSIVWRHALALCAMRCDRGGEGTERNTR